MLDKLFADMDKMLTIDEALKSLEVEKIPKRFGIYMRVQAKDLAATRVVPQDKGIAYSVVQCDFRPTNIDMLKRHKFNDAQIRGAMKTNKAIATQEFRRRLFESELAAAIKDLKGLLCALPEQHHELYRVVGFDVF